MRPLATALLALSLITLGAAPALAGASDGKDNTTVTPGQGADGTPEVEVATHGSVTQPTSNRDFHCDFYDTFITSHDAVGFAEPTGTYVEGQWYWIECFSDDVLLFARYYQYQPGVPPVSPYRLALAARTTLALLYPDVHTSPAIGLHQLVGFDTWMWMDPAAWQPRSSTVSIPGISATVTATPTSVSWDMADGSPPVACNGPGTAYDDARPESVQSTDCKHLYQRRGAYTAAATVTYVVTWSASNGESGTLAPTTRTTQFPMSVAERQAIGR